MAKAATKAAKAKVGFIGMGVMGLPMTLNLLKAGFEVTVWNRDPKKTGPAIAAGARAAKTPAAVAKAADVICLCVFDTEAVEAVVFGKTGVAAAGRQRGKVVVDHSTVSPAATRTMAERLRRETGIGWVDAPVTGGVPGAEAGTLAIFGGGTKADFDKAAPVVAAMSRRFSYMGPQGAGQITKLCNQIIVHCSVPIISEMLALARDNGVDEASLPDVLQGGYADSTLMQNHARRMIARDFRKQGMVATAMKDLDLVLAAGKGSNTPLPMSGAARQLWTLHGMRTALDMDSISFVSLYDKPKRG